ncbi:MAG: Na+/H+ antiporter subunit E [Salinisphaera sp.]|nr:Na+/H+ antiporter subunit E [Salinisphaera sp.]
MTRHSVLLFVAMGVLWVLLSGQYSALLLGLGAASCVVATVIALRMTAISPAPAPRPLHLFPRLLGYWGWLAAEVARANVDVIRCIVHPRLPISPTLVPVAAQQQSELAKVIYANSITLTPGTISVALASGEIEVHALTTAGAADLAEGGMARRVARLERTRAQ